MWPYVPASKVKVELLFDIIATAYERQSLIVMMNLPFENWTEVLGGERLTGAVLQRLTHRCHIIETTGDSYRLNDPQRKRRTSRKEKSIWPSGRACYNSHTTQSQVSDEPRSVFSTLEFHGFWLCENVPP